MKKLLVLLVVLFSVGMYSQDVTHYASRKQYVKTITGKELINQVNRYFTVTKDSVFETNRKRTETYSSYKFNDIVYQEGYKIVYMLQTTQNSNTGKSILVKGVDEFTKESFRIELCLDDIKD